MDTNNEVVNETVSETPVKEAPVKESVKETPPGRVSVGESVRAAIEKSASSDENKTKSKIDSKLPETDVSKAARLLSENRKFAKKPEDALQKPAETGEISQETEVVEPPKTIIKAPQSLKGELKAKFNELPEEWQQEIARVEDAAVKKIQQTSQAASFGQTMQQEFAPYEALLRGAGATPQQALRSFLQNEYTLRTAPPAQKQALALQLLKHYGVELPGIDNAQALQVDPNITYLSQEVQRLRHEREQDVSQRNNAESTQVNSTIEKFAADPKHEHFETVRQHMGALMDAGAASSLDDAYEQACWANPSIRNQLILSQSQEAEAKRKADERKAVDAKRAAGVSVKGAPGSPIAPVQGKETVRQTIARVAAQSQGRI